jgi:hypothetical protein
MTFIFLKIQKEKFSMRLIMLTFKFNGKIRDGEIERVNVLLG